MQHVMNPNLPIKTIMTKKLVTLKAEATLDSIRRAFEGSNFHHLPVTGERGELNGIISREDYTRVSHLLGIQQSAGMAKLCAGDIMTRYPMQLEPEDTIGLAADIFLANRFHALPVIEDGQLVGMVTSHDLLSYCFTSPVERDVQLVNYQED
jgi:CBS-domain-containing membrane protein